MSAEMQPIPQENLMRFPLERAQPSKISLEIPQENISPQDIPRKRLGTDAFNLEYEKTATRRDVRLDILTYLLEYRLQVQEYSYQYVFGRGQNGGGEVELRTDGERKSVLSMTDEAVKDREKRFLPTHREKAEKQGAKAINAQLKTANEGDVLLWASPPGPKNEGYGDYGFLFVGVVAGSEGAYTQLEERTIHMKAIRLEEPTLEQYNKAWSRLTEKATKDQDADFFLAAPTIRKVDPSIIRKTLQETFTFNLDPKKQKVAERVLKDANALINNLETAILEGTGEMKLEAFRAVENYTIERQKFYEKYGIDEEDIPYETRSTEELTAVYGSYSAPAVTGSCGASNMLMGGGNMFSMGAGSESIHSTINVVIKKYDKRVMTFGELKQMYPVHDKYEERYFKCMSCGVYNVRPEGSLLESCMNCSASARCETGEVAA